MYVLEPMVYGVDSHNKPMVIHAFEPLKLVKKVNNKYSICKKCGKGNYRNYMIDNNLLIK